MIWDMNKKNTTQYPFRLFLSYKREDLDDVKQLESLLRASGISLWRDLEYLPLGTDVEKEVATAIWEECSGFLYFVSENSLKSDFIWRVELPTAYERSKRDNGSFPLIPIFENSSLIAPFQQKSFSTLGIDLSLRNGLVLDSKSPNDFNLAVLGMARKILLRLLKMQDFTPVEIFTKKPVPNCPPNHIVLDWSHLFGEGHPNNDEWQYVIVPSLQNLKEALLSKDTPQRTTWLPTRIHLSAALVYGWMFRSTSGFNLIASESLLRENPEDITDVSKFNKLNFLTEVGKSGNKTLALGIGIAKDVRPTLDKQVQIGYEYGVRAIGVMPDINATSVLNTSHAKFLADQAVNQLIKVKNKYHLEKTDLFISSSVQFAAYLGWHLNACGDFAFWQFQNKTGTYTKVFELEHIFDSDT